MTGKMTINLELKKDLTELLCNILIPHLYEGIMRLYKTSGEFVVKKLRENNSNYEKIPSVNTIFVSYIQKLPDLSNEKKESEVRRIKNECNFADIFDDLIKAVIKSHLIALVVNESESSKLLENDFCEKISIPSFIHKCYVYCGHDICKSAGMFSLQENENSYELYSNCKKIIKKAIHMAIMDHVPLKMVTSGFLAKKFYRPHKYLDNAKILESSDNNYEEEINKIEEVLPVQMQQQPEIKIQESQDDNNNIKYVSQPVQKTKHILTKNVNKPKTKINHQNICDSEFIKNLLEINN